MTEKVSKKNMLSGILFFVILLHQPQCPAVTAQQNSSIWRTVHGTAPKVIARGGFSGLFPDSGARAYSLGAELVPKGLISWCDVKLTRDNLGICTPFLDMSNSTTIASVGLNPTNVTLQEGAAPVSGYFPFKYTLKEMENVTLVQGLFVRTGRFDSYDLITDVTNVLPTLHLQSIWLNIKHDTLYQRYNLSTSRFLSEASKSVAVDYVSSPELGFLMKIAPEYSNKTKLIFQFIEPSSDIEPYTKQTYASLLRNLTFVKTFASGILVPNKYILPVGPDNYLLNSTSIVADAHEIGLEVYASGFANDNIFPYDYNYNPVSEYLAYADNGDFSVDGFLTDFPATAAEAIVCFPHIKSSVVGEKTPLVISHNGASGIYPDCTDLAYKQAIDDRTDIIDCPVQVTEDGVLICMSSMNLVSTTTVTTSEFARRTFVIPGIENGMGIYSFNLTWNQIQTLKPKISNPYFDPYRLKRNPKNANRGNFVTLSDFLNLTDSPSVPRIILSIQSAPLLAEILGFDIIDPIIQTLKKSPIAEHKIQIMSQNSSVLSVFSQKTNYTLVYKVDELISNADKSSIRDIKKFASAVALGKQSIFTQSLGFITSQTKVVDTLHSANFSVYVYLIRNEFVSEPFDFFSDPVIEMHNFVTGASVDGVITDFPGTASLYKRNRCLDRDNYQIPLIPPGFLLSFMVTQALPPAMAPYPTLTSKDVIESPMPPPTLYAPPLALVPSSPGQSSSSTCNLPALLLIFMCLASLTSLLSSNQ